LLIKNFSSIVAASPDPDTSSMRRDALEALDFSLRNVLPENLLARRLFFDGTNVIIKGKNSSISVSLKDFDDIYVIGAGKAAFGMAYYFEKVIGNRITDGGIIIPKGYPYEGLKKIKIFEGTHPIPSRENLEATGKLLQIVENVNERSLIFFLLSGGASALFFMPFDGISLEDYNYFLQIALRVGMDIVELNTIRKHISRVKGGRFIKLVQPAKVVSVIISDVIGNRLDSIGSGPTVHDETSYSDAYKILKKYLIWDRLPESIKYVIEKGLDGMLDETLKKNDKVLRNVKNVIIGDNDDLCLAAKNFLMARNYKVFYPLENLSGEAREMGERIYGIIKGKYNLADYKDKLALIFGGETTVTVRGNGVGGRNQELVLSLVPKISEIDKVVVLAAGSDGIDGNSPAAGAVADSYTWSEAILRGMNAYRFLHNNDSYSFFSKLDSAILTGFTGTNVNDIALVLINKK